ncbi:hypothetical protein [Aminipila sp.]|uniref:hypothetical protein n=1 Tax=Aminipila sp. TaxID=2060095 RepID=UPI0028971CF5|nr:hypothetical protein [Aminipila sp.]
MNNIIKPYGRILTEDEEIFHHNRILSKEVQLLKAQYLLIEADLIDTFDFVYPINAHLNVFSPKFALIIKNACNLFEAICRRLYLDIYGTNQINIYNFLALDVYLDFNNINIECPRLESEFPKHNCNIFKPYAELQWDKASIITSDMIPKWWTAYNKIKHDFSNYTDYANLENALRSVYALASLIYKVYGAGVAVGKPQWYQMNNNEKRYYTMDTDVSRLFSNDDGRTFYTFN